MPIVQNPTAGDIHVNRPLTNFGQKYLQTSGFVSLRAMPNLPVSFQSDLYWEFDRNDFYRNSAEERADGAESAGGGFKVSTNPYFARVYAFHKDVTDRQRANQDVGINLDNSATQFVQGKLMLLREQLFLDAFLNTSSVWTGLAGLAAPAVDKDINWLTAGSDPIIDIRTTARAMQSTTGFRPNKMLIGRTGWDTLVENDEILARISGGALPGQPAIVQRQLLAQLFELDEIFVAESVATPGPENGDVVAFQGGDDCVVYYAPNSVSMEEPTAAVGFSWSGLFGASDGGSRIKRIRAELLSADRIEGEMAFDYQVIAPDLGARFTSVSSA